MELLIEVLDWDLEYIESSNSPWFIVFLSINYIPRKFLQKLEELMQSIIFEAN